MVFRSPDISSCTMFSMSMATFWVCTSASWRSSKCFSPGEKAIPLVPHWSHWSQPQGLRWAGILVHRRICLTTRCLYRAKTMRALWALRGRLSCQISPKVEKMSKYAQIHGIHWNTLLNQVAYKKWLMIFMIWGFLWISGIVNRIITGIIPDSLDAPSLKLKPMVIVSTSLYCVGKESGYRNNYDRDPLKDREVKSWH